MNPFWHAMKRIEWRNDYLAITVLVLVVLTVVFLPEWLPVQAAQPAPPQVKECLPVNTVTVSGVALITVFRCQPEDGASYLLNNFGFMKDEE